MSFGTCFGIGQRASAAVTLRLYRLGRLNLMNTSNEAMTGGFEDIVGCNRATVRSELRGMQSRCTSSPIDCSVDNA